MYLSEILSDKVVEEIYQSIGEASMCWEHPEKAGVFKSGQANTVALDLCEFIADELFPGKRE